MMEPIDSTLVISDLDPIQYSMHLHNPYIKFNSLSGNETQRFNTANIKDYHLTKS